MKISLIELEFEYLKFEHTLLLDIFSIETSNNVSSLFQFGWYQGVFQFDILFCYWIKWKIKIYLDERR